MSEIFHQTRALLWKNILLKWRRKWQTLQEWLQNLAFVLLMFLIAAMAQYSYSNVSSPALPLGTLDEFNQSNLTLGYVRSLPASNHLIHSLNWSTQGIVMKEYEDEDDQMEDIIERAVIGFRVLDPLQYHIQYNSRLLRSPNEYIASPDLCNNFSQTSCSSTLYWYSGFLYLQASIDSTIIKMVTGKSVGQAMRSMKVVRMASAEHVWRHAMGTGIFITCVCMCYVSLTFLLSLYVSRERNHMEDMMKMTGLREAAFWLSWGLLYSGYVVILANLMTLVVKTFVFVESSYGVILVLFFLYGLASISFTFMLSALFRNPRVTAIVGFFLTFFLSLLALLLLKKNLPKALEVLLGVFPPFAFAVGLTETTFLELDVRGVFFLDMMGDSFHVFSSFTSLILDTVLYFLLTLYLQKVLPDKFGVRLEPLFFLKSSFWSRKGGIPLPSQTSRPKDFDWGDYTEPVPSSFLGTEAIRIINIHKTFQGEERKVEALRGLDLDVYGGHITALLGHCGAGKTTLLNILSGICRPSSGSASILGYDPSDVNHLQELRLHVGFCPQEDVKFDPLTVKENIQLFAKIKGIQAGRLQDEVQKVISDLQLTDIQNVEAGKLSGGQRRKLTLAIALLGDPQVLLLDEPTAGLDPCFRHQVWRIVKDRKEDRVTLLSTNFIDEADILADRKAVICSGRLKCVGSSLFLRKKWGIGYLLRIRVTSSCDSAVTTSLVQQHVSSATLSSKEEGELTFTLPAHNMEAFPDLFSHLEEHVGRDVVSFGVSMMTLDDVFLKLEGEAEFEQGDYGVFDQEMTSEEDRELLSSQMEDSIQLMADSGNITLEGLPLWRQQTLAVARIRFLKLKRNMKSLRALLLLFLLFLIPIIIHFVLSNIETIHMWELKADLYFLRGGDREHPSYSRLLICNNTGFPIEDFTQAVISQDILIHMTDGPYDLNVTQYRGAIEVSRGETGYTYTIIGNPRARNILPVLVNIISNCQLQIFKSSKRIQIWSELVNPVDQETKILLAFHVAFSVMIFASGMVPHFAMSSIEDTKMKARSLLHVSGLFPSSYWCGQLLVDIPLYWLLLFLMMAVIFIFNYKVLLDPWATCMLIFHIPAYGASLILYVYIISFLLRNSKTHNDWWSFFFVMMSTLYIMYMDLSIFIVPASEITWSFIFPPSSFPLMLQEIFYFESVKMEDPDYNGIQNIYSILLISYVHIFLFYGILWCLEWRYGKQSLKRDPVFRISKRKLKIIKNPEELDNADEDVVAERERVKLARSVSDQEENPLVIVDSLRKEFKVKNGVWSCKKKRRVATRSLSFRLQKGEVLGLLGPNGAGKTTSILMIAGELQPSAGEVRLPPTCVQPDGSRTLLGYCSQDSPLWPHMTVREHLEIYAAVKGLKKEDGDVAIQRMAKALELREHLDQAAGKLSAGVSRKVCFAISMLGNPTIVLLDEPSTGLDPKGRQRVWRAIRAAFKNKERGAILTSHCMEEAEAVCDRVAIMVSGKLRCIGSMQEVKRKCGRGYVLEVKVMDSQHAQLLHQQIIRIFPRAARQERFSSLLVYKIPNDDVHSLSQTFSQLETVKHAHSVEQYSFSQSTLEQVFLDLVKEQEEEEFAEGKSTV